MLSFELLEVPEPNFPTLLVQGAPLGRDFGVFLGAARVSVLGLVPSIVKAWRHTDCMKVTAPSLTTLFFCVFFLYQRTGTP